MTATDEGSMPRARPRAWAAGLLGLLAAGMGQIYLGKYRRAFLLAAMVVLSKSIGLVLIGAGAGPLISMLAVGWSVAIGAAAWAAMSVIRDPTARRKRTALWVYPAYWLAITIAGAAPVPVLLHLVGYHTFSIPSAAMAPSVLAGDFIVAQELKTPATVKHGDIIVFWMANKSGGKSIYLKRVIGLSEDKVEMDNDIVFVNGERLDQKSDGEFKIALDSHSVTNARRSTEHWPNGRAYDVLDVQSYGPLDNMAARAVPKGALFVMGDNRDRSLDSRAPQFGFVPVENVTGVAKYVVYSKDLARIGARLDR
ncbi:MAG TPA: signal peptidase I [Parvularculaceae bacterium]|nr:signal peptidase I [Parvularculaceae bacterium]